MNEQNTGFRHPTRLTHWTRGFLCAYAVVMFFVFVQSGGILFGYAHEARLPRFLPEDWQPVGRIAAMGSLVLLLVWTHRANHNARALGASGLRFTPGAPVGWYFVPIAWFWKPFQAMREIWRASSRPADWEDRQASALLGWWWGLWLLALWGGFLAQEVTIRKWGTVGGAAADFGRAIFAIPATLILIAIITNIHRMQTDHYLGD